MMSASNSNIGATLGSTFLPQSDLRSTYSLRRSMTKAVKDVVTNDIPAKAVESWHGLIVWAVGRFGGIIVATLFLAYAWNDSNESNKRQVEKMIDLVEKKTSSDAQLSTALMGLTETLKRIQADADNAHRALIRP